MQFDPNEIDQKSIYKILTGAIIPRPIGWISSVGLDGVLNIAPFSYFNAVGDDPPHIMFSASRSNNQRHFEKCARNQAICCQYGH